MELNSTQQQKDKANVTAPLVEWLDTVRGEESELQFEKNLGLARNSIRNIREGRLPGYDKLVKIRQGTGVSWEFLGSLLEAPFDPKTVLVKKKPRRKKPLIYKKN
ncbi:hypothetical protein [Spirulina sp. 06S082]|uniref:hypothetical protein n=1 Tax=Spirulina sp. 06S082 TaxID=3110248 RepID=UPI002B1F8398|nr:hypothetical protein [Spirulina sp. 06S082]MEA5469338.1 hypothetical protein [Spirulina sp. 06S082]